MGFQWYWWWWHQLIHPLSPSLLRYPLTVGLHLLLVLIQGDIPPWGLSVYETTRGSSHPMTCLRGDHYQGLLLTHLWQCILMMWVWCQKADAGREILVSLQLQCILTQFGYLWGCIGMQHQGLFSLSWYVLREIWCTWMRSCGVSWGGRSWRNMAVGCT